MTPDTESRRRVIHALIVKIKFYRIAGTIFLVLAVAVFLTGYFTKVDGQWLEAMRHPLLIVGLLAPFLPAAFLTRLSDKARKELARVVEQQAAAPATPAAEAAPPPEHKEEPAG